MAKLSDKNSMQEAYSNVRNDTVDMNWLVLGYKDNEIVLEDTGTDFSEFASKFSDDERKYGFLRVVAGDELSKRAKFALIQWLGHNVSAIKRARMATDKAVVKEVIRDFAKEFLFSEKSELNEDKIITEVKKAGGANYGTGSRD
ncbi:hypothetical protein FSP39_016978 [Pinctada imbricata]|uniref:Coactosin-like protein n=1 Tax=Pinctada imbricata TaxID=66713 RepID=A0AA88XRT0_PINIB|nr:hypothetical protein FSP39_016978 [Pinctada imbricata]